MFAAFLFISMLPPIFATDFSGKVVSILDGDPIELLHQDLAERIRFNGSDCPEKGQAYGKRVK